MDDTAARVLMDDCLEQFARLENLRAKTLRVLPEGEEKQTWNRRFAAALASISDLMRPIAKRFPHLDPTEDDFQRARERLGFSVDPEIGPPRR